MRPFVYILGIIFVLIGVAGFVPNLIVDNHLVTVFRVNFWLNSLHLLSGILAFVAGCCRLWIVRLYYQVIGVVYGVIAAMGFLYGDKEIWGFIASNSSNTWFHVIVAVASLILGFSTKINTKGR